MARTLAVAIVTTLASAASGCANFASFQTAHVVEPRRSVSGVGVTVTQYELEIDDDVAEVTVPALNVWYRYGLLERVEVHAMVWLPLGATAGVKYQAIGYGRDEGLSVSFGLDVGSLEITADSDGDGTDDDAPTATIYDVYVPVYIDYRFSPGAAAYAVPKYLLRTVSTETESSLVHYAGGAVGLALGKDSRFFVEGVALTDLPDGSLTLTGGLGFAF